MAQEDLLPEFIRVIVPQKEKDQTPIAPEKTAGWVSRFCGLVSSKPFRLGYEKLPTSTGGWPKGRYDPATGEWVYMEATTEESNYAIKAFCSAKQFPLLRASITELLEAMGRDLNQDSVAYETRQGLHTIKIR